MKISTTVEDEDDEGDEEDVEHVSENEDVSPGKGTLRETTPFGRLFVQITESVRQKTTGDADIRNIFYSPDLLRKLQTAILPLLPFWTLIVCSSERPHSNAPVESYFKTLKQNILRGRSGLLAGDCTRVILKDISSRVKEDAMLEKEQQSKGKPGKRKAESRQHTSQEATPQKRQNQEQTDAFAGCARGVDEEQWGPKKKRRQGYKERTVPSIFKSPSKPFPEKEHSISGKRRPSQESTQRRAAHSKEEQSQHISQNINHAENDVSGDCDQSDNEQLNYPEGKRHRAHEAGEAYGDKKMSWTIGNVAVHQHDLNSTMCGECFNDVVIDSFLLTLTRYARSPVTVFSSHALTVMRNWPVSRTLAAELSRYNLRDIWVLPLNLPHHWAMFVVNRKTEKIVFLDSMCPKPPAVRMPDMRLQYRLDMRHVQDVQALLEISGCVGRWAEWELIVPSNMDRQVGGNDCGVHVCLYAECVITGRSPDLRHTAMPEHRRRIREAISVSYQNKDHFRMVLKLMHIMCHCLPT